MAAAAVVLALLALCSACSSTVGGHAAASAEELARPPRISSCWHLATPGFGSPLAVLPARSCTQPHEEETVWVATDALPAGQAYPTYQQLDQPPVAKALDDVCNYISVATYLGDEGTEHDLFMSFGPRLPSRDEWEAGARWVRCDVMYGLELAEPAPGRMAEALKGPQAAAYHNCYTGSRDAHDIVPCSRPHLAEVIPDGVDLHSAKPIPTDDRTRTALAEENCETPLQRALGEAPRPAGARLDLWDEPPGSDPGYLVTCVLVRVDGASSSTAMLP